VLRHEGNPRLSRVGFLGNGDGGHGGRVGRIWG
jgi:hypothetical protein